MSDIDAQRLLTHLRRLARPRASGSLVLEQLRDYVTDQLRDSGWEVTHAEFAADSDQGVPLAGVNLIARQLHWLDSAPCVCVAAHLDSRPETPGADDNASGVAALLEIAHCWSSAQPAGGAQLELVITDLEESGMLGGAVHARRWLPRKNQLVGMIALEMLGYCDSRPNTQALPKQLVGKYPTTGNFIAVIGNQNSIRLIDVWRAGLQEIPELPVETLQVPENGNRLQATRLSDHSPFWDLGFPAVMITDTSFLRNPHYHLSTDTVESLNLEFLQQVTRGCLRAIVRSAATLALSPR